MQDFDLVAPSIIASIMKGESIVVHCKGGLSRAGTVVALLLQELGIKMSTAVKMIRDVRSVDCINQEQEEFLADSTRKTRGVKYDQC